MDPQEEKENSELTEVCEVSCQRVAKSQQSELLYKVDDVPPWYLSSFLALQHYLVVFVTTASTPLIYAIAMCLPLDGADICNVVNTLMFVAGIATLLQTTFGTRLPIVQGASFSFLMPAFAILSQPKWHCPEWSIVQGSLTVNGSIINEISTSTGNLSSNNTTDIEEAPWKARMREIQGTIMVASLFQILVGATGVLNVIVKYIGPLTIAPTIAIIGMGLFTVAADTCALNWPISVLTIALIALFSQYLRNVKIPLFRVTVKQTVVNSNQQATGERVRFPIFTMFSFILSMMLVWLLCFILTVTGALGQDETSRGYHARTDLKLLALSNTPWFRFPYPFQWGLPTVSVGGILGMLAGTFASIVESIGDYYVCAQMGGASVPPHHAINRGILMEGLGTLMCGLWGTGVGTTSYSQNIAVLGITKVGSRQVIQIVGIMMVLLALLGKFAALFVAIPSPILGGMYMVMFGTVAAVGISSLQYVNLNSSRNLFIFGTSLLLGLSIPVWLQDNPQAIETGLAELDQVLVVLAGTGMFIAGITAFIMDNTIPGTPEERGITHWSAVRMRQSNEMSSTTYDLPCLGCLRKHLPWTKFLPFCPSFNGWHCLKCRKCISN